MLPHVNECKRGEVAKIKEEQREINVSRLESSRKRVVGGLERHLEIVPGPECRLTVTTTATDV